MILHKEHFELIDMLNVQELMYNSVLNQMLSSLDFALNIIDGRYQKIKKNAWKKTLIYISYAFLKKEIIAHKKKKYRIIENKSTSTFGSQI